MFNAYYTQFVNAGIDAKTAKKAACMAAKAYRTPEEQAFVSQIFQQLIRK